MQAVILIEKRLLPIPDRLTVIQDFGYEYVHSEDGSIIDGTVMMLDGATQVFSEWLSPFDGFWVSSNPAGGEWRVGHIKED